MITRFIQVYDELLPSSRFEKIKQFADKVEFHEEVYEDDSFTISHSDRLNAVLTIALESCLNHTVTLYLGFLRLAAPDIDIKKRIHSDMMMQGRYACVYYINTGSHVNGTKFYKHDKYGYKMPMDLSIPEINRVLSDESDKDSMWDEDITINSRPNRLLIYESDLFHAKFPSRCMSKRIVWVGFFDI